METLGRLFGNTTRVKIMRLFIFNPDIIFDRKDVEEKIQVSNGSVAKELKKFNLAGFIKRKAGFKDIKSKNRRKGVVRRRRVSGWTLNPQFQYLEPLRRLLISSKSFKRDEIAKRFRVAGNVRLLIIAGIFIQNDDSRIDILVVGDSLRSSHVTRALKSLESEAGRELRYSVLKTREFLYRLGIYDKFVRDVLDFPHETLIDRIGVRASR